MDILTNQPTDEDLVDLISAEEERADQIEGQVAADAGEPPPAPAISDEDLVDISLESEKRAQEIETNLAVDQNKAIKPEDQARALRIAEREGLPVDTVRRNLDKFDENPIDVGKMQAETPSLAKLTTTPHGPISQFDIETMGYVERVLRSYTQAFRGGFDDLEASDIGYRRRSGTATPNDLKRLAEIKAAQKQRQDFDIGSVAGFLQYPVASAPGMAVTLARTWDETLAGTAAGATIGGAAGVISGPGALPAAGAGAVTGAVWGSRTGFVLESFYQLAGDAYNQALEARDENGNPLDEDTAYAISTFAGGVGAVAELLPFERALDTMPFLKGVVGKEGARQLSRFAANNPAVRASLARIGRILKVGGAEAFTEVLQEATMLESIIAAGGVTDEDGNVLADQRIERYGEAALGGFAGGSTLGATGETITATKDKISSMRLARAEAQRQALIDMGDRIRGSKVNALSPETIVAHAQQIDADGNGPQMSAPAEAIVKLFQSEGLTPEQVQQAFPTLAQALDEAAQGNAEVPLNAETVVRLAQLDGFGSIADDIRTAPGELTVREAKEREGELEAFIAGVSEEDQQAAVKASVEAEVSKQFVAAGMDPKVAETNARLHVTVLSGMARESGKDLDTIMRENPLRIVREGMDGQALDGMTLQQGDRPDYRRVGGLDYSGSLNTVSIADNQAGDVAAVKAGISAVTGQTLTLADGTRVVVNNAGAGKLQNTRSRGWSLRGPVLARIKDVIESAKVFAEADDTEKGRLHYKYAATNVNIGGAIVPVKMSFKKDPGASDPTIYALNGYEIGTPVLQGNASAEGGISGATGASSAAPTASRASAPEDGTQSGDLQNLDQAFAFFNSQPHTLFQSEPGADPDMEDGEAPVETAGEPVPEEAVTTASLESANNLSKSRVWDTGRQLKMALQNAVLNIVNGVNLLERTAENRAYLVKVGVKDALAALAQNANAIGWYDLKTRQALAVMSLVHPELATDETSRFAFTWALATTSNGIKVDKNFELAEMVYSRWKASNKDPAKRVMPTDVKAGKAQKPINKSLQLFNDLSRDWGLTPLRLFMLSNFKAGDIKAMTGIMPTGEWAKTDVRGASVIGPKIGNGFFSNLYGKFDALTMDRWLVRTWGRWTGTLIEIDQANVDLSRTRLREAIKGLDRDGLIAALRAVTKNSKKGVVSEVKPKDRERLIEVLRTLQFGRGKGVLEALSDNAIDALSDAVLRASQEPKFREAMNGVKGGEELRKAGNSLAKYLDGQKEQPAGPGERVYIREIFSEMLSELQQDPRYKDLTMSDLQAVLWYAEKRLYETAKEDMVAADVAALEGDEVAGYDDDEAPDYANAAAAVARTKGVTDRRINAALKKEEDRGRSDAAQQDAGGAGSGAGVQAGQGQQGQARGFTESERREFIQRRALDRVRSNRSGDAKQSWSYARGSGGDGKSLRVLAKLGKALGASVADVWSPGKGLKQVFSRADIKTPDIYELEQGSAENAARFVSAISQARETLGPVGEAVHVYPANEYQSLRLFLTADGKAGFALKPDGDIVSVFSAKGTGAGRAVMETAIAAGGKKLDCFATVLPEFYSAHGFKATSRLLWNDEVAKADMPGWDKAAMAKFNNGEPDVVFMVYDPDYKGSYDRENTRLFKGDPENDYGRALKAQAKEMKAVASKPTVLNQSAQSRTPVKRGFIEIAPGRTEFKITLTGKADLSTFQHEAAHYYLEVLQKLVESGSASARMAADLEQIRSWMKLEPNEKIEVRHHEMFARGWEAYLMEGRSPSADLQGVFNRFRAWMVFVYKRLTALNVELTDEVRSVFDRLVASDAQIAEARTSVGWAKPLPKEALYLTDDEYDRYVEAWNKANEEQQRAVDARLMLEAARETQAAWKEERRQVFEEEKAKLAQTRGYKAWKLLTEGTGLADAAPGRTTLKIDPATVPSEWRRDVTGMTEEGGLPLDAVAEILGFNSGEEMISVIAGAKYAERDLPSAVKQIMSERHGDLDATALADIAMQAVHSDNTQEVLLSEYRAMAERAGLGATPTGMTKWMAAQAQQKVLGLTRRQLDPMRWRRAELKAAQQSAAAASKGDVTKAAIHKRQQMMAAAMYKASIDADKRVDVIRKKLMPFTKNDRRAKLGKAGDLYLDGIDQILEDIQLKPMSAASVQKLDRLQKLVEEADKSGEPLVLPDKLRAMLGKKNFADMTLEELEGVHDAVMNIWHLAKLKNELKARNEKRQLDEALTEMEANAQAALGDPKVTVLFTEGWKDRAAARMRALRAGLTKMEFLFGWLDGKPDGGLMHRLIYQPIADANKAKYDILKRFHETLIVRMREMPNEQKARWEAKRTFMGNPTANGATIISAALNLGNEGNKRKLLEGYGWNEQRLMAEINSFMTKADWDFVQHVWNEIDTLWPKIEATTKAATGLAPEKVVPTPVQTPFGTYAGGYYPVVYDPAQTEQQFKNQQEGQGLFSNNYARPTLGDGFTKGRVDYAAPILLRLDVISRHLAEVVHYVTHYEAVTQADKITRHPRFQAVVKGHMGNEFYRTIRPWLQDVARDQDTPAITNQEPFAKAMRYLRGGMSIGAMGYNVFTGLKQLIGVVQSLDAIGPRYWLQGLAESWLSPNAIANWKFAFQNSQELDPLITQFDRDIKMINDAYAKQGALSIPAQVSSWAFKHIGWLQAAVNVATWRGAYAQELKANGGDHDKAVMHADSVVRKTQSAGSVKDLSPIQRGSEINRSVSMFYSWFNVLYNRLEDIAKQTKGVRDVPKAAARVAVLVMMSSMIEEASRRAWEGIVDNYEDDDEERGYILSVLMKSADTLIGAIPLARAFISAEAASGGMKPELTPVGRISTDYYRTMGAAYDLIVNQEAPTRSEAKTAVRTISTLTHIPLSGPYNFLDELFGEAVFDEGKKQKN